MLKLVSAQLSTNVILWSILLLVLLVIWGLSLVRLVRIKTEVVFYEIASEIGEHYFCGHSVMDMIERDFFRRFSDFNEEGFCYTYSAIIMLALRKFKHTRIVRGCIDFPNYRYNHSWTEIRVCGRWWVIDVISPDRMLWPQWYFYKEFRPEIKMIYNYQEFWRDPFAEKFQQRLQQPATSHIFWEIFYRYTPYSGDETLRMRDFEVSEIEFADPPYYMPFPLELGWKYS